MGSPVDRVRDAVEAWRRDEARERVYRWRGSREASSPVAVAERHAWVASSSAADALDEALDQGLLGEAEHGALAAHLARAAAERELAEARRALRAGGTRRVRVGEGSATVTECAALLFDPGRGEPAARALASVAGERLGLLYDARVSADEAGRARLARARTIPDAGPAPDELRDAAERLLALTDDVTAEVVRPWTREGARWDELARGLRSSEVDPVVPRRDRWRRVAGAVAGLGFERELAERVRAERDHGALDPRARVAVVVAPTEVRVAAAPLELGVASELTAADALGRALALCLVAPALPVELRRPVVGSVARAFGTLLAQLVADPVCLRRRRELSAPDTERLSRVAGALLLLETRGHAAAVLARAAASGPSERAEVGAELLGRALGVRVPPSLAASWVATPAALGPRLRGRVSGLVAATALRDRYDEDWFDNPRADEPLRAAASRGGALCAEEWCAEELGARGEAADVAAARLIELTA